MQSSSTSPHPSPSQIQHQHSPKHSSPLSQAYTSDRDTATTVSPISSISYGSTSTTSPESSFASSDDYSSSQSQSSAALFSDASSLPVPTSPEGENTTVTRLVVSTLSANAPQFQSRLLDVPIDIHQLTPPEGTCDETQGGGLAPPAIVGKVCVTPATQIQPILACTTSLTDPVFPLQGPAQPLAQPLACTSVSSSAKPISPSTKAATVRGQASDFRTPNVYINGLPPNFPEEDLFKMTHEFGQVVSVRTFTSARMRQAFVSIFYFHMCGYGFVLFETVDAAEKCIEALRKYRNLHPSFSKQIHKIPGTIYSSPTFTSEGPNAPLARAPADSFKARMEQLKDTSSTNLYMEGLPMSIDDATLAALVRPYRIMSSRFFQTRLSNPPRMIAFVRLETRAAAEEIIERLHGRLVRGWEDSGCRISVRFADTSEQRELRRMERITREDEHSPARISIAQATLLNLKGNQLNPSMQISPPESPSIGLLQTGTNLHSPLFPSTLGRGQLGIIGNPLSPLSSSATTLPFRQQPPFVQSLDGMQDMSMLLDRFAYDDFRANASAYTRPGLRMPQNLLQDDLLSLQDVQAQLELARETGIAGVATRAENGFTPMERILLQMHVQRQQAQKMVDGRRDGQYGASLLRQTRGSSGSIRAPSGLAAGSLGRETNRRLLDILPPVSEDDFHATAGDQLYQSFAADAADKGVAARAAVEQSSRLAFELDQISLVHQQHQRNQTHASHVRANTDAQVLHARSTTLPSKYFSTRDGSQTFLTDSVQNNSNINSSILSNSTNNNRSMNNTSIGNASLDINSANMNQISNSKNGPFSSSNRLRTINNTSFSRDRSHLATVDTSSNGTFSTTGVGSPHKLAQRDSTDADDEDDHSPLVSPALTYSARTPASLSPATPFFHGDEKFCGPGMGACAPCMGEAQMGEKQKMRVRGQ